MLEPRHAMAMEASALNVCKHTVEARVCPARHILEALGYSRFPKAEESGHVEGVSVGLRIR